MQCTVCNSLYMTPCHEANSYSRSKQDQRIPLIQYLIMGRFCFLSVDKHTPGNFLTTYAQSISHHPITTTSCAHGNHGPFALSQQTKTRSLSQKFKVSEVWTFASNWLASNAQSIFISHKTLRPTRRNQ